MNWHQSVNTVSLADLDNPVDKAGATESVAIGAIIWGIALIIAATNA